MGLETKSKKKAVTTWYVEARDSETNRVISQNLGQKAETSCQEDVEVSGGETKNLWEVSYGFIIQLENLPRVKFVVYRKQGKYGSVSRWTFGKRGKPTKKTSK